MPLPRSAKNELKRRPALGGALEPTREDAAVSHDLIFEYSQQLSQKVIGLEAENVELQDDNSCMKKSAAYLTERVAMLEQENAGLRDAGLATFQERNVSVRQCQETVGQKQGEVMLLRKQSEEQRLKSEALSADNARWRSIAERLQSERSQLQRQVCSLETTTNGMQAEITHRASAEGQALTLCGDLERKVDTLTFQKAQLDQEASLRHFEAARFMRAQEELGSERAKCRKLEENLQAAVFDSGRLREECARLSEAVSVLHVQVAEAHGAREKTAAEMPVVAHELERERECASAIRARIHELEGLTNEMRRSQTALEAENSSLRQSLTGARNEVARYEQASASLMVEKGTTKQKIDQESHFRYEAEQRSLKLADEGARLRSRGDLLQTENVELHTKTQNLESENVALRARLRGTETMAKGLRDECSGLNARVGQLHGELHQTRSHANHGSNRQASQQEFQQQFISPVPPHVSPQMPPSRQLPAQNIVQQNVPQHRHREAPRELSPQVQRRAAEIEKELMNGLAPSPFDEALKLGVDRAHMENQVQAAHQPCRANSALRPEGSPLQQLSLQAPKPLEPWAPWMSDPQAKLADSIAGRWQGLPSVPTTAGLHATDIRPAAVDTYLRELRKDDVAGRMVPPIPC